MRAPQSSAGNAADMIYDAVGSNAKSMSGAGNIGVSLASGVVAGVVAAIISHPADTLLSKINSVCTCTCPPPLSPRPPSHALPLMPSHAFTLALPHTLSRRPTPHALFPALLPRTTQALSHSSDLTHCRRPPPQLPPCPLRPLRP